MKHLLPIIALTLVPTTSSCVAVMAAGAAYGLVKYDRNEAYQDFETSIESAWSASIGALEASGYFVEPTVARDLASETDSARVEGDGYWLRVEKHIESRVRVRVRIGTFESTENKRKAALILEAIEEQL